jgi:hypothetical protein
MPRVMKKCMYEECQTPGSYLIMWHNAKKG